MLKYFDEFVGKDLGFEVFAQLLGYFAINMTPVAFPLAVLLSSLMTFGNLGEHFELTAIKSSGISLIRALLPIFVFTSIITVVAFLSNNYIVPRANLKAYSLLYDIRQKKPSLDLKEGAFYNGLPGYSIKANKKYPDGMTLKDLIIYDHTKGLGNTDVIIADSGKMYTINDDAYLKLEMYRGNLYSQQTPSSSSYSYGAEPDEFVRNKFYRSVYIFSLSSFDLQRTDEQLFASNRLMKNVRQLNQDIDSMRTDASDLMYSIFLNSNRFFVYHLQDVRDIPEEFQPKAQTPHPYEEYNAAQASLQENQINIADSAMRQSSPVLPGRSSKARQRIIRAKADTAISKPISSDSLTIAQIDSIIKTPENMTKALGLAVGQARYIKNHLMAQTVKINHLRREVRVFDIEKHKKYTQAVACLVMFLIGAPLGAIIKKGGLGVPVIVSILFFIIYYVASILGEKWGRENIIPPALGAWGANLILLPFGMVFLRQARNDARLFEADFYKVVYSKIRKRLGIKD